MASSADGIDLASYSNFGSTVADIMAPGGDMPEIGMLSTLHQLPRGHVLLPLSGTSMAAPVVSGIAALALSLAPELSAKDLKSTLMTTGIKDTDLENIVASKRHINALSALESLAAPSLIAENN